LPAITPQLRSGLRVNRNHLIARSGDVHHSLIDERRGFVSGTGARAEHPCQLEYADVLRCDLVEWTVAPAAVGAADLQPVTRLGTLQTRRGDFLVFPENARKRSPGGHVGQVAPRRLLRG